MDRLRISAVITAWNEGDEVRKTVESLAASIEKDTTDLEIIIVDDGSTDGSCEKIADCGLGNADLKIVRHDAPQGVGRSRNAGYAAATGDVISFHDAHMRFAGVGATPGAVSDGEKGGLEYLAMKALQSGAIVCAASAGLKVIDGKDTPWGCRYWGCDLFHNFQSGLEAKWQHIASDVPPEEWLRSPCMMGAGYVISRWIAEGLIAPTGLLWEDVEGRWGFSEEALSVKAFLLGIPVLFSRDVIFRHAYRGTNPVKNAGTEKWRNICRSTFLLFDRETWQERFKDACLKHLGQGQVDEITNNLPPRETQSARRTEEGWREKTGKVFTHLCGKRATVSEPHPDQAWLPQIAEACQRLGGAPNVLAGAPSPRVLQWRPGEATVLVRRLLPNAEIVCVEAPGHRASNWAGWCAQHNVTLFSVDLGPAYCAPPDTVLPNLTRETAAQRFDLVLVGGEMQAECRAFAESMLRPGGTILTNPGMDRLQIIDEERRKEEKAAADALQLSSPTPTTTPGPEIVEIRGRDARPLVTVCLLNWQRPDNIGPVLDSIRSQTLPAQVYLWNNGRPFEFRAGDGAMQPIVEHPLVKIAVQSSQNLGCFPRWALAALADTEFVCSLDDDLAFADPTVLEDAIAACREECPDGIVGFFGWAATAGQDYGRGYHPNGCLPGTASIRVDVIKGRFMLMRRAVLERVPLEISVLEGVPGLSHREDDVYVSLCVSGGRPGFHVIPARLGRRWKELPSHGVAASGEPGHYARRDEYIRRIGRWLKPALLEVASGH
jgi:hypothetical protein